MEYGIIIFFYILMFSLYLAFICFPGCSTIYSKKNSLTANNYIARRLNVNLSNRRTMSR